MPEARAFCARRVMSSSTFLPTIIMRSASSSTIDDDVGQRGQVRDLALVDRRIVGGAQHHHRIADRLAGIVASFTRRLKPVMLRTPSAAISW